MLLFQAQRYGIRHIMTGIATISLTNYVPSHPVPARDAASGADTMPAFSSVLETQADAAAPMREQEHGAPAATAARRPDIDAMVLQLLAARRMMLTTTGKTGRSASATPAGVSVDPDDGHAIDQPCVEKRMNGYVLGSGCELERHPGNCLDVGGSATALACALHSPRTPVQSTQHRPYRRKGPRSYGSHRDQQYRGDVEVEAGD